MTHMKLRFQEMNQIVDFVNLMNQFEVDADIKFGHIVVDAKSLLGVMNIAQKKEVELILHSDVADLPPLSEQLAVYAA
ncbi:MAG: HPr family phosphocarrier protein [Eubacteriales bacterium]|nr:HPr family phosphocarrier protein [Eubacteriales bacterium]